jgi:hypothetical protein
MTATFPMMRARNPRLVDRVQGYLAAHPEVSREQFVVDAIENEMVRRDSPRRFLTASDVELHAWLDDRLTLLRCQRQTRWQRLANACLRRRFGKQVP